MAIFNLTVQEFSVAAPKLTSAGIGQYMLIGTSGGADTALLNQSVGINSVADFQEKFPTPKPLILENVKLFFLNNPTGSLSYFPCFDSAATGTDLIADKAHLVKGLQALDLENNLALHITSIPEMETFTAQEDRTLLYTTCEAVNARKDWLFFVNSAVGIDTKAEALAERNLYSSTLGHASYYYGRCTTDNNIECSLTSAAAAIALRRSAEDAPFKSPAGVRYPIVGVKKLLYYVNNFPDYNELRLNGINVVQDIRRYGKCFWGARTLAKDRNILNINTRMAISVVVTRLEEALLPLMFEASDPQGRTTREINRTITSVMETAWKDGAFSGGSPAESYRIVQEEIPVNEVPAIAQGAGTTPPITNPPPNPIPGNNTRPTKIRVVQRIYASFVGTTEEIEVKLYHTEDPTLFATA